VLVLTFAGARISGNPFDYLYDDGLTTEQRAALSAEFGLDRPLPTQFAAYVAAIAGGNFGVSIAQRRPVVDIYAEALPSTLVLAVSAFTLTLAAGLPLGVLAAIRRGRAWGAVAMGIAFLGYAVPHFVLAIILVLVFGLGLSWLPSVGGGTPWHYVLPTVTLAAGLIAAVVRFLRGEMLDVMGQDHVRTARATGLPPHRVLWGHVARNAALPVLTVIGLQLNGLINGSLIIETVFALPGIGQAFVGAVQVRDYPVLQFGVMAYAVVVVAINLGVDALYAVADPRIRRGGTARMAEA
jgi:ABC-type dipeptide/oligopeptide/nickel transport system permease component